LHETGCSLLSRSFAVGRWPLPCRGCSSAGLNTRSLPRPLLTELPPPPLRRRTGLLATLFVHDRSRARLGFLSWGSSKTALPPMSPCESTLGFPRFGVATPEHVPPLLFLSASAACSTHGFAGLLHPATGRRVRLVSRRLSTFADTRRSSGVLSLSKSFLASSGFPVTGSLPPRGWSRRPKPSLPPPRGFSPLSSLTRMVSPPSAHGLPWVPSTQAFTGAPRCQGLLLGFPAARCE